MPDYRNSNRDQILSNEDIKAMLRSTSRIMYKAWISILWITGARPAEALLLKPGDITINPTQTLIKLHTLKHKDMHHFIPHHRNLCLNIDQDNVFINPISSLLKKKKDPDTRLFDFSIKTGYNIINKAARNALGKSVCPYNFRHSRMTLLAESGASIELLKRFKGAFTDGSVRPYLHVRKVDYTVEI